MSFCPTPLTCKAGLPVGTAAPAEDVSSGVLIEGLLRAAIHNAGISDVVWGRKPSEGASRPDIKGSDGVSARYKMTLKFVEMLCFHYDPESEVK